VLYVALHPDVLLLSTAPQLSVTGPCLVPRWIIQNVSAKNCRALLRPPGLIRLFYPNRSGWIRHRNFPLEPLCVSFAREPLGYDANIEHAGRKHAVIVFGFSVNHLTTPLKILGRLLPEVKSLLLFILQLSLPKSSLELQTRRFDEHKLYAFLFCDVAQNIVSNCC
jgi:hypothetical protein